MLAFNTDFYGGGGLEHKKIAWIKWDTMCLPKDKEGIGIKTFNIALLGKWRWDLFRHHGELWARILEYKYGDWRCLAEGTRGSKDSIWWQDLMATLNQSQQGTAFQNVTGWSVGCGDKARFWEDCWTADEVSLMIKYPRLYRISCQQKHLIQQLGSHTDAGWEWSLTWRRLLFDNEVDMADVFLADIAQFQIQPHRGDSWVWKVDPNGQY